MTRPLTDANAVWLIHSNIARFQQILRAELTISQRQAVERLLANQLAELEGLDRSKDAV